MPSRNLVLACAVVCLVGLGRMAWFDSGARPHWVHGTGIDERYAQIVRALPATTRLGYLTDEPMEGPLGDEHYTQALYALAPRALVMSDSNVDVWLAQVGDPRSMERLCAEHGLVPVQLFDEGHQALLRRKSP